MDSVKMIFATQDDSDALAPRRASAGAAGWDLFSPFDVVVFSASREGVENVSTGLFLATPEGVAWEVRGRSSLAGRGVLCHPGLIDADYRGEVRVILANVGRSSRVKIQHGVAVAQLVMLGRPYADVEWQRIPIAEFARFSPTARGAGGFGSTDRRV